MDATVHLIDSDLGALDVVCDLVRSFGVRVTPHHSSAQFLSGNHTEPGCLVANLGIPGMNGIEFLRQLNACAHSLPAVFVATHASTSDTVSLMQLGAVSLLEKPYRKRTLIAAIQSAVRLDAERRLVGDRRCELQQRMGLLSDDERVVLNDLVAGRSNKWIASSHGIALRTVEYRRHNIFAKLEVNSIAGATAMVAELERLTDISAMLHAPPMHLADSRFDSFGTPLPLRIAGRNPLSIDPPHERLPEPVFHKHAVKDSAPC